ncbi:Mitochondrial amidoxime-reducing component 1 [Amphibalanus amphitrite]|uniref:Mitochondrial amidoxime-reducing component 1 n=1 Tax=Amphibalanus amphitrite TaxID=1232801 RepID=A0A6A4VK26_AMPAM|nr:mitochondrial amidoxime-reducing component 1-like [Amphibalanus amphitrite]KAF0290718.1 Mitochondrial amidoxime-reducing component 1 [Amphibalanus amphitrite]
MVARPSPLLAAAAGLAVLGAAAAVVVARRRQRRSWTPIGTVRALTLYPLKSGAGQPLQRGRVTLLGLRGGDGVLDRSLAVVCGGKVMDAGTRRRLVLISAEIGAGEVTLSAPEVKSLTVPLPKDGEATMMEVDLNGHPDSGADLGPEAARWLHEFFADGKSYSLMYFLPGAVTPRRTSQLPHPYVHLADPEDAVTYNFVTPLSVICDASIDELNRRLASPVTVHQFRHNIVVGGAAPFDDDDWRLVRVGGAQLRRVKPVHRCGITLVDPNTGERSDAMEPLRTLRTFRLARTAEERRLYKEAPLLGSALAVDQEGDVAVGDTVYVTRD